MTVHELIATLEGLVSSGEIRRDYRVVVWTTEDGDLRSLNISGIDSKSDRFAFVALKLEGKP
jgi:hypothetical protein